MKPHEWLKALAPGVSHRDVRETVEREVRILLAEMPDDHFTTAALAGTLWPVSSPANQHVVLARKRLFAALGSLAMTGLKDCCYRGTPRLRKHSKTLMITPWIWKGTSPCLRK